VSCMPGMSRQADLPTSCSGCNPGGLPALDGSHSLIYFTSHYVDLCGHPFGPPFLFSQVQVTDLPFASVTQGWFRTPFPAMRAITRQVMLTLFELCGEVISLVDTYQQSNEPYPTNASAGGVITSST